MKAAKEWQKKGRQLDNKFVSNSGFIAEEYVEDKIAEVTARFRRRYPNAIIEKHKNKQGTRIVVYEKK